MKQEIKNSIQNSIKTKEKILNNSDILSQIEIIVNAIMKSLTNNNKIILAGNGGSASDALHLAGEFLGRFYINREPIPAIVLNSNVATLTAIGNDYNFDEVFARQLQALGNQGDIFIAISTSGNSKNILKSLEIAKKKNLFSILLTGKNGGQGKKLASSTIIVPSDDTPRIQESHILIGHIICELVEKSLIT